MGFLDLHAWLASSGTRNTFDYYKLKLIEFRRESGRAALTVQILIAYAVHRGTHLTV